MVALFAPGGDAWNLIALLRKFVGGDSCSCQVQKRKTQHTSSQLQPQPAIRVRDGEDCGPDTAAWLLNEHGPEQHWSKAPETRTSIRRRLGEAWKKYLDDDVSGDEHQAFVQDRLEQVPAAQASVSDADEDNTSDRLRERAALTLKALLRDDPAISSFAGKEQSAGQSAQMSPYWFLPSDWARLSEEYQVDFVLHGLPGTEGLFCDECGCCGHVHAAPQALGTDISLHVAWRSVCSSSSSETCGCNSPPSAHSSSDFTGGSSSVCGHWEPLGVGPIWQGEGSANASSPHDAGDDASLAGVQVYATEPERSPRDCEGAVGGAASFAELPLTSWPGFGLGCQRGFSAQWSCQESSPCSSCPRHDSCHGLCPPCEKWRRGVSLEDTSPPLVGGHHHPPPDDDDTPPPVPVSINAATSESPTSVTPSTAAVVSSECLPASGNAPPKSAGARFCVFLQGPSPLTFAGGGSVEDGTGGTGGRFKGSSPAASVSDGTSNSSCSSGTPRQGPRDADAGGAPDVDLSLPRFRRAFAAGLAAAVGIAPTRVRVVDVGPPIDAGASLSPGGGRRSGTAAAAPREQQQPTSSAGKAVDNGAGVLSFLEDDEDDEMPTSAAAEAPPAQVEEDGFQAAGGPSANGSRGVTRILFVVREASFGSPCKASYGEAVGLAGDGGNDFGLKIEEPSAMKAIERAMEVLRQPGSALHDALQPWIAECGGSVRLWCPEAAGDRGLRPSSWSSRRPPQLAASGQGSRQAKLVGSSGGA